MESIQCVRNEEISLQLSLEEKASVDEMMKQAEFCMESQELVDQSIGVVAENECLDKAAIATKMHMLTVALRNLTKGPLTLMASKIYEGYIWKIGFPKIIAGSCTFTMSAMSHKGVKAAVVYSGMNKGGVECAWLLAFADTKAKVTSAIAGRRVYVECGRKSKFSNINWAHVEQKLNNAGPVGPVKVKAHDKETGTSLYAAIAGAAGKTTVGAAFLG